MRPVLLPSEQHRVRRPSGARVWRTGGTATLQRQYRGPRLSAWPHSEFAQRIKGLCFNIF